MSSRVRESARFIVENAQSVEVHAKKCFDLAPQIYRDVAKQDFAGDWHSHELNPDSNVSDQFLADWIFAVDTLNFCFWSELPESERFTISYKGKNYTGYWSLCAAINRALDEGIPITTPSFWRSQNYTEKLLADIFRSETDETVPLLKERYLALQDAANALEASQATSFLDILKASNGSAQKVVEWAASIACYKDEYTYLGRRVCFYKRAQILVGETWAAFGGKTPANFIDIDELTMFADYRVPQILHGLGLIGYSEELERKIREGVELAPGSPEECELRGASIHAVELLVKAIKAQVNGAETNSVLIDFNLWDAAKERERTGEISVPVHRVRSIFY